MSQATLSRIGALIALFALMVLPLASCGTAEITGPSLFQMDGAELHKLLVLAAALAAVLAVFLVTRQAQIGLGAAGLLAIAIAALMVLQDDSPETQVRYGALVAAFGFLLVLAAGLTQPALPAARAARKKRRG